MSRARLIAFYVVKSMTKSPKIKSPVDIIRLSFDDKPIEITEEKRQTDLELVKEFQKGKIARGDSR